MLDNKKFINSEELLLDSYRLCKKIYLSGFKPDFIVGIWRGGSPVGIAIQDCLDYLGVKTDHISLRTSYRGMLDYVHSTNQTGQIRVHGIQYLLEKMNQEDKLLLVDDVFASGTNVEAVLQRLQHKMRRNFPKETCVAVPWYKPAANQTGRVPEFYLYETDQWLVFPYELNGLSQTEIAENKPEVQLIRNTHLNLNESG